MAPRADRPKRRSFTAEFKAAILAEYDAADREERGAILRREGVPPPHRTRRRVPPEEGHAEVGHVSDFCMALFREGRNPRR